MQQQGWQASFNFANTVMACTCHLQVPQVLELVLQQCPDLSTPRSICSLLQVSSACRQAVQQARVECVIDSTDIASLSTVAGLSTFALWLPEHRGLVSVLDLEHVTGSDPSSTSVMQNVIALAFKACACTGSSRLSAVQQGHPAAAHASACAGAPPALQLARFSAGSLASPVVLAALASTHVRKLHLHLQPAQLTPALCEALAGLHSLRQLHTRFGTGSMAESAHLQRLAMTVRRLPQLVALNVAPFLSSHAQHLPASLTGLTAYRPHAAAVLDLAHGGPAAAAVDLAHLTALQDLFMAADGAKLLLPPQVTSLGFTGGVRLSQSSGLLQVDASLLTRDHFVVLQELSTHAQLRSLRVRVARSVDEDPAISALQACTSLTRLTVVFRKFPCTAADAPWCKHIAKLTQLVELYLFLGKQDVSDLLQLSALTRLTGLIVSCRGGWEDSVCVALACKLVNLRTLRLKLNTVAPIPVIGNLTGLRDLGLVGLSNSNVRAQFKACILNQLLPLRQLTRLVLPLGDACPGEARQHFLSQMPGLTCIGTWG
jgi:hypothetical protein